MPATNWLVWSIISIHAPTRGATSLCLNCGIKKEFQSTLPREERLTVQTAFGFQYVISIHAPTRGATGSGSNYSDDGRFQSTLPREERPMPFTFFTRFKYFNPRSHERSDSNIAQKICLFLYNTDNKYIIR